MGGGLSFIASADIRADWKEVFSEMELNNADVQKLNKVFSTFLNADSKGVVKISKALDLLEIDKSRFNEKIFLTFDKDNTRCIDLYAFVVSLWKFCCLQRVAISKLIVCCLLPIKTLSASYNLSDIQQISPTRCLCVRNL